MKYTIKMLKRCSTRRITAMMLESQRWQRLAGFWIRPDGGAFHSSDPAVPNPAEDLNAMHDIERCIPSAQHRAYAVLLCALCTQHPTWMATARERATAYLMMRFG